MPERPPAQAVERVVERIESSPDLSGPIAAVDKRARKALESAQAAAERIDGVAATAGSVAEQVQAVRGEIERVSQQVIALASAETPATPEPAPAQSPEPIDAPTRAELAERLQAAVVPLTESLEALRADLAGQVAQVARIATEASAGATHATAVAASAMSRDIPQPAPLPDFLTGIRVENGHLIGTYQSGKRGDFGALPKPRVVSGGRASSAQVAAWGGAGAWGSLTGTLSNQADLQAALDAKEDAGTAAAAIATHEAAADPHTGYQKESEKGANSGYASLDGSGDVPRSELPATVAYEDEANVFAESQAVTKSTSGTVDVTVTNTNSGTAARTGFIASNDGGNGYCLLQVLGTGWTTSGSYVQDGAVLDTGPNLSGGLSIVARAGNLRLYTGGGASGNLFATIGSSTLTLADAKDIVLNATTGTKIGTDTTQKLGFYNATPIAQRAGAAQAAVATTGATNVAPFGFTTAAQANAIVTLVNELRAWAVAQGFIKGSA